MVDRQRVTKTCPEEVMIINPGAAHAQTESELCPLLHVALGLSLPFPSCSCIRIPQSEATLTCMTPPRTWQAEDAEGQNSIRAQPGT